MPLAQGAESVSGRVDAPEAFSSREHVSFQPLSATPNQGSKHSINQSTRVSIQIVVDGLHLSGRTHQLQQTLVARMLESTVLHQSRDVVVGLSWKAPTRSHPIPSLVVTCPHQVVVYKPGEERRTHQWSFKPSAATVLSHAAVFLPARSRYVGVQQGSTLVSWRESEHNVKRPISSQAAGPVQAVHACPQLGDYFVAVLTSGAVALYEGGLQRVAHCDAAGGSDGDGDGSAADARSKAVWSGVRGNKVLVVDNIGDAVDRVTVFALSVTSDGAAAAAGASPAPSSSRRANAAPAAGNASATANTPAASVALVSSHVLDKPPGGTPGAGEDERDGEEERASACSAAFLGHDGIGGAGGRSAIAVAWRSSRGPVWTKVVLGAGGATQEFVRPAGTAAVDSRGSSGSTGNGNGVVSPSPSNGSAKKSKKAKAKKMVAAAAAGEHESSICLASNASGASGWGRVPAIAAADGGRLLVHSGGGGGANPPRIALWDAAYGVLLEDGVAPEVSTESGGGVGPASRSSGAEGRAVDLQVSRDGAHLALAVAGKVLICPLPVKATGTLASLLRRKRPSSSVDGGGGLPFPSVDLSRSGPASKLLQQTGALQAGEWEAAVVTPFRQAEAEVIRSLRDAARRRDDVAFGRTLREHLQQRAAAAEGGGAAAGLSDNGDGGEGAPAAEDGRKKRRRGAGDQSDYAAGVVAAAVELCLVDPGANLWSALGVLVRSGGVSARHHRGLVATIVEYASPELLEEVMLHVPDLPEADAVRILRHFLSQAATLADTSADEGSPAPAILPEVPNEGSGGPPPTKRAKGGSGGAAAVTAAGLSDVVQGEADVVVSVLSPSKKRGPGDAIKRVGSGGEEYKAPKKKKKHGRKATDDGDGSEVEAKAAAAAADHKASNGNGSLVKTKAGLSNGHAATHDDGGTSSDSGGVSDGGKQAVANGAGGKTGSGAARNKEGDEKDPHGAAGAKATAAARAERGVRVALTLPHNEAFLRSALAELSHGEVVVVLKILTRLLTEGKTLEATAGGAKPRGKNAAMASRGLPPTRTDAAVGWACALLDSHFTRLAMGGAAAESGVVGALKALKKATRREAECCELLSQVRSLVDEVGRRQAAAAAAARRGGPSRERFTLRVVTF